MVGGNNMFEIKKPAPPPKQKKNKLLLLGGVAVFSVGVFLEFLRLSFKTKK